MNRKIIQKVIDALKAGTPDKINYAMGILDALIESLPEEYHTVTEMVGGIPLGVSVPISKPVDEASLMDNEARIKLERIKGSIKYE